MFSIYSTKPCQFLMHYNIFQISKWTRKIFELWYYIFFQYRLSLQLLPIKSCVKLRDCIPDNFSLFSFKTQVSPPWWTMWGPKSRLIRSRLESILASTEKLKLLYFLWTIQTWTWNINWLLERKKILLLICLKLQKVLCFYSCKILHFF